MVTRTAAVAGMFYPDDKECLLTELSGLISSQSEREGTPPSLLVVPHAGYQYSGTVAAQAYKQITDWSYYERVLLLGPSHRVPLRGMALSDADKFSSPLGELNLDTELIAELNSKDLAAYNSAAHELEHSLEVQLPFLQFLNCDLPIIPVVVGVAPRDEVASLIRIVEQSYRILVIVSTDLSHFHSFEEACDIDRKTIDEILQLDSTIIPEQACGCFALNGALSWWAEKHRKIQLIEYKNSGDVPVFGDKSRVVGYAAFSA